MNFIRKKSIFITLILLFVIWLLWLLTHFLINFKLVGNKTIELNIGEDYKEYGVSATFLGNDLDIMSYNNINTNKVGNYVVYYKARNVFGIAKSIKRNVIVKDSKSSIITLKGDNPYILGYKEEYIEPGYVATDNVDGDITNKVEVSNNINNKKYGEYKVIYKIKDSNNNITEIERKVIVKDKILPVITLKGKEVVDILLGEKYVEEGYNATDNRDGDITDNVKVSNNIKYDKTGNYKIIYKVTDSSDNTTTVARDINIVDKLLEYKNEYEGIDNKPKGWWSINKLDHKRPSGGATIEELNKYNAYYLGPDEKTIYLTYDEGSNDTYLPQIVDILDKYDIKATFFLCQNYMLTNKDLIKKMVNSGHIIGNHTSHHNEMPKLATKENFEDYVYEIKSLEKTYKDITGKDMEKIYREPSGKWSYRSLQIMKDLGYKTYFYSAYYYDYGNDVSEEYALNKMLEKYHNGAIYLFHPKNKGNLDALDDFIIHMKELGYKFDLVKNINY